MQPSKHASSTHNRLEFAARTRKGHSRKTAILAAALAFWQSYQVLVKVAGGEGGNKREHEYVTELYPNISTTKQAEEHHQRGDRAEKRPDAGIYEVIIMMFGTGHVTVPVFCPSAMIPIICRSLVRLYWLRP